MPTNMVERVARAIGERLDEIDSALPQKAYRLAVRGDNPSVYMDVARAAIEAMREPTDVMLAAGDELAGTINPVDSYLAMLDAALEESK